VDAWEDLARAFSAETGVPVRLQRQPADSDQRRQLLSVALKARQPDPDVFLMDVAWIGQLAASGALEPLDAFAARDKVNLSAFFPAVLEGADRWQGALVGLPVYVDAGLLYYRRDLLQKYGYRGPPATWEDLAASALRVQAGERRAHPNFSGYLWQGAQYEGLICCFLEAAASAGGGLEGPGGRLLVDTPPDAQALEMLAGLIRRGVSPSETYTSMREEEVRLAFQRGDALYERNWPYAWLLHQEKDSPVRGKVGLAPLPAFPGGRRAAALGGWHAGVSAFSDRKEDAWRLVRWLTSRKGQKKLVLALGWNPGRRDLYGDPEVLAKAPHLAALRPIFEEAVARPRSPRYAWVSSVLQRRLNAALAGRAAPEDALRRAQKEIDAIQARTAGRKP
jgi:multiple sugar transport system substrate-binding protein